MTRLPDFVLIGTMKSGTTSLFRWLGTHPAVRLPERKEPMFFGDDRTWSRGVDWYSSLFPSDGVTGEASAGYTAAAVTEVAASRAATVVPSARLLCLLREPSARLRSHYVHERQRGRERRRFLDAVAPDSAYVTSSCYDRCLAPWVERFGEQLLVVRAEDLDGDDAWASVLTHLGLDVVPRPADRHNVSGGKERFGPLARRLFDARIRSAPRWVPSPVRRVARRALLAGSMDDDEQAREARTAALPDEIVDLLTTEAAALAARLGTPSLRWG